MLLTFAEKSIPHLQWIEIKSPAMKSIPHLQWIEIHCRDISRPDGTFEGLYLQRLLTAKSQRLGRFFIASDLD